MKIRTDLSAELHMEGDKLLIGNLFSDVRFIEGIVAGRKREKRFWLLAWLLHFLNGIALAEVYAAIFPICKQRRNPYPYP